jgi:hypothetical protein
MNAQQIAVAKTPELPCVFAISQPRKRLVDFPFLRRNLLQGKSLRFPKGLPCPTDILLLVFSLVRYSNLGLSPCFSPAIPISSSLFPQIQRSRLPFVVPPYYYFPVAHYAFTGTSSP